MNLLERVCGGAALSAGSVTWDYRLGDAATAVEFGVALPQLEPVEVGVALSRGLRPRECDGLTVVGGCLVRGDSRVAVRVIWACENSERYRRVPAPPVAAVPVYNLCGRTPDNRNLIGVLE